MNKIIKVGLSAIGGVAARVVCNTAVGISVNIFCPEFTEKVDKLDMTKQDYLDNCNKIYNEHPSMKLFSELWEILSEAIFIIGCAATYKYLGSSEQKNSEKLSDQDIKSVKNEHLADKDFDHSFQQDQDEDQIAGEVEFEFVNSDFIAA